MKRHECTQGSPEWFALRAGIPTASAFSRIVTPGGKLSSQAEPYMFDLIAERFMGHTLETFESDAMARGSFMESEAGRYYAFLRDCEPEQVGFITNDAETVGASADRLVGDKGLLEIKCPAAHTHVGYLFGRGADKKYMPQLQGQLWVCEREWVDIISYHPEMPEALVRVERDDVFIGTLAGAVGRFVSELAERFEELLALRGRPEDFQAAVPRWMQER